jgi:hypothetical protein
VLAPALADPDLAAANSRTRSASDGLQCCDIMHDANRQRKYTAEAWYWTTPMLASTQRARERSISLRTSDSATRKSTVPAHRTGKLVAREEWLLEREEHRARPSQQVYQQSRH